MQISGSCVATATDAEQAGVGSLAEGRGELITLALWLLAERLKVRLLLHPSLSLTCLTAGSDTAQCQRYKPVAQIEMLHCTQLLMLVSSSDLAVLLTE